jgi:hypothetical protein
MRAEQYLVLVLYLARAVSASLSNPSHIAESACTRIKTPRCARRGHGKPGPAVNRPDAYGAGAESHPMGQDPRPQMRGTRDRHEVALAAIAELQTLASGGLASGSRMAGIRLRVAVRGD